MFLFPFRNIHHLKRAARSLSGVFTPTKCKNRIRIRERRVPRESPLLGFPCLQSTGKTAVELQGTKTSFRSLQRDQMDFNLQPSVGGKLKVFTTSGAADKRNPGKETTGPHAQAATLGDF